MKVSQIKIELLDVMGTDDDVADAARVSFDKTADEFSEERNHRLIAYLAKNNHWSPFSHCFLKFRIKAPMFVRSQLIRHTVGLAWNEVSRRYVKDEPEFWFPKVWRGAPVDGAKQGSHGVVDLGVACAALTIGDDHHITHACLQVYNNLLNSGVAPEQARMVLPLNTMTEWIWTGSLMAFARVCKLRLDSHAQAETREIAALIDGYAKKAFPVSWEALMQNDKTTID